MQAAAAVPSDSVNPAAHLLVNSIQSFPRIHGGLSLDLPGADCTTGGMASVEQVLLVGKSDDIGGRIFETSYYFKLTPLSAMASLPCHTT